MAGIYVHIPFCKQACFYCDFHFSTSLKNKDEMLSAIKVELMARKNEFPNETIETIYFGGGTPSLLAADDFVWLMDLIRSEYHVIENPEITLEANPDDLSEAYIVQLTQGPINRLSIGIQSFFDDDLKMMNRAHNATESKKCLSVATRHFENITVDLIYGIPGMGVEKWRQNLQYLFDLGIPHISSYALTVEPNTALDTFIKKGSYPPLDETLAATHFNMLVEETAKNGFVHYEISNFGKKGFFSQHNTSYWQGVPYLGIGPSAHSFDGKKRSWNVANNAKYIKSLKEWILPSESEILSSNDQFNEYVMTGLRTIWGIDLNHVKQVFGQLFYEHLLKSSQKFVDKGLLIISKDLSKTAPVEKLTTTQKGKFLADGIASDLFILN